MSEEIKDLEIIKKGLEDKIKKLRIEESNLKASIHAESMRLEAQKKLDEVHLSQNENIKTMKLDAKEERIFEREKAVERLETVLKDRIAMIEKREQQHVYLEKKFEQLNKERKDFESMKRSKILELEKIKEDTTILSAKEGMLIGKEDDLRGREKAVVKKELFIQDEVGRLTEWEKRLKTETEHLEGLKKELNYV